MKIHFHEPPPAQRLGGLDAAIRGLQSALDRLGHDVIVNPEDGSTPPEIAHFHGLWQPAFRRAARAYKRRGVPYVVSPHGMLEPWAWRHKRWKKFPYWHLVEAPWVRRAACVLATAPSEARRLKAFLPKTFIEILALGLTGDALPNYDGARARLGWAPNELVLLFLSRIHEKKGLDLLLAALAGIHLVPPNCRLVIVGPEEQREYADRCRRFATENATRLPRIDWIGPAWGDDRWPYLQGADLFCLPTHSENFGLVVLEACQVGTLVLTTTTTPWADVLRGHGGFSAEPETASIRGALERFLAQGRATVAARDSVANWARQTYDWVALGPRYAALYQRLAQAAPRVEG
jgi:glycosyltransferase involved in cell wall biosynthesis